MSLSFSSEIKHHTLSQMHSLPRTVCDVEIVADSQAPHFASDAGGDALPPEVSHSSRCAPAGGFNVEEAAQYVISIYRSQSGAVYVDPISHNL